MKQEVSLRGRKIGTKGNQQAAQVVGMVGSHWYRTQRGALVNIELAQKVDVVVRADGTENAYELVASYNDGTEEILGAWPDEATVWSELDLIAEAIVEDHKMATTRIRLGHG